MLPISCGWTAHITRPLRAPSGASYIWSGGLFSSSCDTALIFFPPVVNLAREDRQVEVWSMGCWAPVDLQATVTDL